MKTSACAGLSLVVVVVEELGAPGGPDVSEQRGVDAQSAEGVSPHDGHRLLPVEPKVVLEEVQGLLAVSHGVRVDLLLSRDVRPLRVLGHTVRPAGPEGDGPVEDDLAASLSLEVVTASHGGGVVALHVVGLDAPLHGHDGGQGPEVSSALT